MKQWLAQSANEKVLFLEPEDKSLLSHIGKENCVTIEDLASKNVVPAKRALSGHQCADGRKIPIRSNGFSNDFKLFHC